MTVDDYIATFNPQQQAILQRIRQRVQKAAPDATERIRWAMPTYYLKENLVHFAMHKNHVGFYPTPNAVEHFKKELAGYQTSKGAIKFPLIEPIPYDLIEKITIFRLKEVCGMD